MSSDDVMRGVGVRVDDDSTHCVVEQAELRALGAFVFALVLRDVSCREEERNVSGRFSFPLALRCSSASVSLPLSYPLFFFSSFLFLFSSLFFFSSLAFSSLLFSSLSLSLSTISQAISPMALISALIAIDSDSEAVVFALAQIAVVAAAVGVLHFESEDQKRKKEVSVLSLCL